jgi:hypothetical protein
MEVTANKYAYVLLLGKIVSVTSQICYAAICFPSRYLDTGPPLWASGQSSLLQIKRSGFDSRQYQIFWEVVGQERGPLSLESTTEELQGSESSEHLLVYLT